MITKATGAVALVIAPVARDHGIDFFLATVVLAGILQVLHALVGGGQDDAFHPATT